LPSTLKVIKIHAFYSCKRLSEIIFSENLKEIEDQAFIKCNKLKEIQFPEGVKLGKELFEYEK
ncbi:MAG: leucine-rich repeat protein, partial [Eubacteriales bacterium]